MQAILDTLTALDVNLPDATRTWRPVAHAEAFEVLMRSLAAHGLEIHPENVMVETTPDARKCFVRGTLLGLGIHHGGERGIEVGVLNDHRKERGLTLLAGERLFVCSNGMVFADHAVKARRTPAVLDAIEERAVGWVRGLRDEVVRAYRLRTVLSSRSLTPDEARAHVMRLAERGIVGAGQTVPLFEEYSAPSFDYSHRPDTLEGLRAAATHTLKRYNERSQAARSRELCRYLEGVVQ